MTAITSMSFAPIFDELLIMLDISVFVHDIITYVPLVEVGRKKKKGFLSHLLCNAVRLCANVNLCNKRNQRDDSEGQKFKLRLVSGFAKALFRQFPTCHVSMLQNF